MNCSNGVEYLEGIENQEILNEKLEQAIVDIKEVLFTGAQNTNSQKVMNYKSKTRYGTTQQYIPAEIKVFELSEQDWDLTYPRRFRNARGLQNCLFNKILLKKNNWCKKTIIHEALHSLSIFNSEDGLRAKFPILEDGITEFFTGYVLYRKYPSCYSQWKSSAHKECSLSYARSVRRFYAFCNFINLSSLTNLYFWVQNRYWIDAWAQLIDDIKGSGYPNFRDVTQIQAIEPTENFFDECEKNFGSKFKTLFCSQLDYDNLLV